jgi:endonuclease V-like protein UPF0215 family
VAGTDVGAGHQRAGAVYKGGCTVDGTSWRTTVVFTMVVLDGD